MEREEVSLVNGRLVKQTRRNRALWVHDPVQAVEVLRTFKGILHVQFNFAGEIPDWYQRSSRKVLPTKKCNQNLLR